MVTIAVMLKVQKLYVLPHSPFLCCMDRRSNNGHFLYRNEWLVFITENGCVYCAVRTGCLHIIQVRSQCALGRSVTGQLDPCLPWFSSVIEQVMRLYPKSTRHCMLLTQPSPKINFKFFAKPQPFQSDQNFVIMLPSKHKIQPKFSSSFLCCTLPTFHYPPSYFLHFSLFFLAKSLPLSEGQAGTAFEPSEQLTFLTPPFIIISAALLTASPIFFFPLSLSLSLSVFKGLTRH